MLIDSNDPPAVPLWVSGHVFLTMATAFQDVRRRSDGKVLRRTPLCDGDVVDRAIEVARNAAVAWRILSASERGGLCMQLAHELAQYSGHFCKLLVEETGKSEAESEAEVLDALDVLRHPVESASSDYESVVAIIGSANAPLVGPLRLAVAALMDGSAAIIKPDPAMPSVFVALGELSGRCGFPPGVFNVVHGGDAVLARLHELDGVRLQLC